MSNKKLLIFDLGGVVFWHTFDNALRYWAAKGGSTVETLRLKYRHDEAYARHEVDQISIAEYKDHVCRELGIELSLTDFITGWNSIFLSEVEGMGDLLGKLALQHRVVALSNTNHTHCEFVKVRFDNAFSRFHKMYFSHEIRCRKPDREAFETVLNECGALPSETIFFDDLVENIEGAQRVGVQTVLVKDFSSTVDGLQKFGLI